MTVLITSHDSVYYNYSPILSYIFIVICIVILIIITTMTLLHLDLSYL